MDTVLRISLIGSIEFSKLDTSTKNLSLLYCVAETAVDSLHGSIRI